MGAKVNSKVKLLKKPKTAAQKHAHHLNHLNVLLRKKKATRRAKRK